MRLDEWNAQGNGFALSTLAPWIPERVLHPYRSAIAYWPGAKPRVVGFVGEMNPGVKSSLLNLATGKTLGVVLGELRIWESFFEEAAASGQRNSGLAGFQVGKVALSRALPVMSRDLALVINPLKTKSQDLERALRKAAGPELRSLECLDVYPLNETSHSLAFRAVFQGQDATLTESDVAAKVSAMLQAAEKNCGAMLRST
jgi:phenylalanyl-tRNA synthetase beta subunit